MSVCVCSHQCVEDREGVTCLLSLSVHSFQAAYYWETPIFTIIQQELLVMGPFLQHQQKYIFIKVSISIHNIIHKFLVQLDYKLQLQEGEAVSLQVYVGTHKLTPYILVSCTNFGRNDDVHVFGRSINKYISYRPRVNIIFGRNIWKINKLSVI